LGVSFASPRAILLRAVPASYARCLRSDPHVAVDVEVARLEHAGYVAALEALGVPVEFVPAAEDCPDACFLEDTAVVIGRHAVLARPGAPSRRAETEGVAPVLARYCEVSPMLAPATLDGGDVLRVGTTLFVGVSGRTNEAGVACLADVAKREGVRTIALRVGAGLHLKSACTLVDERTLLYAPSLLASADLAPLRAAGLTCLAAKESVGANALWLGSGVLVSADAPETALELEALGHPVCRVAVSQFHKGDGALTCLSLRVPQVDAWST
jgi:dimethylargininase